MAAALALLLTLAIAVPAFAFPTSSTVYPSYSGCTTYLNASAGYQFGNEIVWADHVDTASCASTVAVYARALILGVGTISSGPDIDAYWASTNVSAADFYYGYGLGSMYVGGQDSGDTSTLSVHP